MKMLCLLPYSPEPPIFGGALRILNLLNHLVQYHEVTLVCFGGPTSAAQLRKKFRSRLHDVQVLPFPWTSRYRRLGQLYAHSSPKSYFQLCYHSEEMQSRIDELLDENDYDIVQAEFCMMTQYHLQTEAVRILDAHNVEYDNYSRIAAHTDSWLRKQHYLHECKKLFHEEILACRKQDAIFVTSARDKQLLDESVPEIPKYVVPNGVDSSYFHPTDNLPEPFSLVFTGSMGYVPNYDGMLYFLDQIFPIVQKVIPQAKVYIAGNLPPGKLKKRASKNIVITGFVEDIRPYIWRSSVSIVPLRMGGGTRLKILEAIAMKRPIVTTSIGCEGIEVRDRESVLIADRPQEFADSVVELLRTASLRTRLVRNGYELIRSTYEWSVINGYVEEVYHKLVSPRSIPQEKQEAIYDF